MAASSKPLTSVTAVRRRLLEMKEALQHDVWQVADWNSFQRLLGEYSRVESMLEELGVDGAEQE